MVGSEAVAPQDSRDPDAGRMPRRRFWLAVAAGVALGAAFVPLVEYFFTGRARSTWPAYAIVLPLAIVAAWGLGGTRWWPRAAGTVAASGVATVAVAFAGLFFFLSASGHCGLSPSDAQWSDPALYGAMPRPGALGDQQVTWTGPEPGLPFGRVIDPAWGPHNLTAVDWIAAGLGPWEPRFTLGADRVLRLQVEGEHSAADVRARFIEWATHATAADEATRAAWADAFLASNVTRHEDQWVSSEDTVAVPYTNYLLEVPGPLRLEELHASLAGAGAFTTDPGNTPGHRGQHAGAWVFGFSLGVRTVQHGAEWSGPDFYRLSVDSSGTAAFVGLSDGERSEEAYAADVAEVLAGHGLPRPDPESMHVSGSIC